MAISRESELVVTPVTEDDATTARFYAGFNFRNTTETAVVMAIYDGTDAGDILIESVAVPGNGSLSVIYPHLIGLTSGSVFVDWTTGIVGSVRVIV